MGESLSSVIPSAITFVQGVANNVHTCENVSRFANESSVELRLESIQPNPRFSVAVFFTIIGLCMLASLSSFLLLNRQFSANKKVSVLCRTENEKFLAISDGTVQSEEKNGIFFKKCLLLGIAFLVAFFMYDILPAVASYSTLPYSYTAFNLSINLGRG